MKVVVAVLTYNRMDLFKRTIGSLKRTRVPYTRIVVDNASTDGTTALVEEMHGICNRTGNHHTGMGYRLAMEAAVAHSPELIVFSGDDFEFREGWLEKLVAFWEAAPACVAICGMYIEALYAHCPVKGVVEFGGQRALLRGTLPGASWSYRPWVWEKIKDLVKDDSMYYDKAAGQRLVGEAYLLAQLPLSEHTGAGRRMWRAGPEDPGMPVDRKKWRI